MTNDLLLASKAGSPTILLLHISAAFYTVRIIFLNHLGISGTVLNWFRSNRTQTGFKDIQV